MRRSSGLLLHFTSLPGRFGVGDLGPEAHAFAEFLVQAGQSCWQVLPIAPTSPALGNSPYSGFSAFAGHTLLLSPEFLAEEGFLDPGELDDCVLPGEPRADFEAATRAKAELLRRAFERCADGLASDGGFQDFCRDNAHWLDDYALFMAVKEAHSGRPWNEWPEAVRRREPAALAEQARRLSRRILAEKFGQHLFFRQWGRLRARLAELGVRLIGDVPIYVTHDSADVWVNQHLFKLDPRGRPLFVAGVPPDYFSKTGQRWGNPVFDWRALEREGFSWWLRRLKHNFGLFDLVRLDHFRGFAGYWEIPAAERTAVKGRWVFAAGEGLFRELSRQVGRLPIIAEDLGVITEDVVELKEQFGFPGMKILQFSFGPDMPTNPDALHNHDKDCVVYTGTHDNNTTRGWFRRELKPSGRKRLFGYLGKHVGEDEVHWDLIRLAMMSVGELAVIPVQDALGLEEWARMNTPGAAKGNWGFRLTPGQLSPEVRGRLHEISALFGRNGRKRTFPDGEADAEADADAEPDEAGDAPADRVETWF
jgi:4-alpha-glucanotransferase